MVKFSRTVVLFSFVLLVFLGESKSASALSSDLNANGIPDADETEVVVSSNAVLPAGEYVFNNLTIANNAAVTLDGDAASPNSFKGVKITAKNITVNSGSALSADHQGYGHMAGPGAPTSDFTGASYGGVGLGNGVTPIYGSAAHPIDLGSGGYASGGGAIRVVVSETLRNDGEISARGDASASGGSIYVTAHTLLGAGLFSTDGGSLAYFQGPGGGGRIALYYDASSFTGTAEAKGGCASYDGFSKTCAGDGTVGFFDTTHNDLHVDSSWRFQKNDGPFNFNDIFVTNGAHVTTENDVGITSARITLDAGSSLFLSPHDVVTIPRITVTGGSTLTLSGEETITADTLTVTGNGTVTIMPEHILSLTIPHITVSADSTISANEKGYGYNSGPGAPVSVYAGASYGGLGAGNAPTSVYGSSTAPTDFGSGGIGYHPHGGGAVRLIATSTLSNDGIISADGSNTSSGGSVYVTAGAMSGSGAFRANGGGAYCPYRCIGPGGGGRVALYYATSTFAGAAEAKGGCASYDGFSKTCAGDGTVVVSALIPAKPACTSDCFSNVLFLPGLEASRLYMPGTFSENRLWEPNWYTDVQKLYLDQDGNSVTTSVYTRDVIDEAFGFNIYKKFIASMNALVADGTIKEWRVFPYDWRRSVNDVVNVGTSVKNGDEFTIVHMVDQLVDLAKTSKTGKVTIIGHSNGGLVGKLLINELTKRGKENLVDKFIMVAVPQLGTPEALAGLLHGDEQLIPPKIGFIMGRIIARQFAENMPGAYSLLPSTNYFAQVSDPVIEFGPDVSKVYNFSAFYGSSIDYKGELDRFLLGESGGRTRPAASDTNSPNVLNQTLLTKASATQDVLDAWTAPTGIAVTQVVGWGLDTVRGIRYDECHLLTCTDTLSSIDRQLLFVSDGDGTVVVPSANKMTGAKTYYVNLPKHNTELLLLRRNRSHASILEVEPVQALIQDVIENKTDTLPRDITITKPEDSDANKRLRFRIHSPVSLDIYDADGDHTGLVATTTPGDFRRFEANIPNSYYREFGEIKYAGADGSSPTEVVLVGQSTGTFTLEAETVAGNTVVTSSVFTDIPVVKDARAVMEITSTSTAPTLSLDINHDGISDVTLASGTGVSMQELVQILRGILKTLDIPAKKKARLDTILDKLDKQLVKEQQCDDKQRKDTCEYRVKQKIDQTLTKLSKTIEKMSTNKKAFLSKEEADEVLEIIKQIRSSLKI